MSLVRPAARILCALVAIAAGSPLVQAQALSSPAAGAPAGDKDVVLEQVTVTATRVERSGYSAPTPTTVVSADDIQNTGATDVAQFLSQNVPGFYGTGSPTSSTLSGNQAGMNFVDLRSLGPQRTLVLVDGQRFVPTTQNGQVDLNVIPQSAVENVEVVTGGASAQWGSDAVSGVVNIITNRDLVGFRGNVEGGISQYGDDRTARASLAFGNKFADDRGHFTLAVEGFNNSGVLSQADRPWASQGWQIIANPAYVPGNGQFQQLLANNVHLSIATEGGVILGGPLGNTQFLPGGIPVAFNLGTSVGLSMIGGDGVNMGKYTALDVPITRDSALAQISYKITDAVTASLSASYANTQNNLNVVQPFDLGDLTIKQDNAFLPASIRDVMLAQNIPGFAFGRVDTDFGFHQARISDSVARVVAGIKLDLGGTWSLDTYYEYGRTRLRINQPTSVLTSNYADAVDAVLNPSNGQIVCRSTLTSPGNGCVPIDLFGAGAPSQAALDYIHAPQTVWTTAEENAAAATVRGEPFSNWAGPISVAAGLEFRREASATVVDPLTLLGKFNLGNPTPSAGSFNVKEGFVEAVVPLAQDVFLAKSVNLDGAVRETDYSSSGRVTTWKAGLTYEPAAGVMFRASRSRDIRAPSIEELFIPAVNYYNTVIDQRTGAQITIRDDVHGNPNLKPEESDTTTVGVVWRPTWLSGLRASLDYYDIAINGAIATLQDQEILDRCESGNAGLCQFIHRDVSGQLTSVDLVNINLNTLKTRGYDISADYRFPANSLVRGLNGNLGVRFLGTYVQSFVLDDGVSGHDFAGDAGANSSFAIPHMKWTTSLTYRNASWGAYLGGRFVGGGWNDHTLGVFGLNENHVDHQFLVDLTISHSFLESADHAVQVFATVNNVFNSAPPIDPSSFFVPRASNPVLYDPIGRVYKLGLRVRL